HLQSPQRLRLVHARGAGRDDRGHLPPGGRPRGGGLVLRAVGRLCGREGRDRHRSWSACGGRLRVRVPDDHDEPPPEARGGDDLHDDGRVALLHELPSGEGGREPGRVRRRTRARRHPAAAPRPRAGARMTLKLAARLGAVKPSAVFAVAAEAAALRAQGRDVIDLSAGEPDFDTPEHVKAAAREALARGLTKYTPIGGTDVLKDAVVAKLQRDNG